MDWDSITFGKINDWSEVTMDDHGELSLAAINSCDLTFKRRTPTLFALDGAHVHKVTRSHKLEALCVALNV